MDGTISSSVTLEIRDHTEHLVATEAGTLACTADGVEPTRVWSTGRGAAVKISPALPTRVLFVCPAAWSFSDFFIVDAKRQIARHGRL